jgi:hypothetical protein
MKKPKAVDELGEKGNVRQRSTGARHRDPGTESELHWKVTL